MKQLLVIGSICIAAMACKNNGSNTSSAKQNEPVAETTTSKVKEIIVGAQRKPAKPDFQVKNMSIEGDVLTVLFQYGGGCAEHDFNAHFSGAWLKSLPPQAILDFEHLNPEDDRCRSIVLDSISFNLAPLRFGGASEGKVIIKYPGAKELDVVYEYTN